MSTTTDRFETFLNGRRRLPHLSGPSVVSVAAALFTGTNGVLNAAAGGDAGSKAEFVRTYRDPMVGHPSERRNLEPGERVILTAEELPYYLVAIEHGALLPAVVWDAIELYDRQTAQVELLTPAYQKVKRAEQEQADAEAGLVAAKAALKAAENRLATARENLKANDARLSADMDALKI
jgi:hypothetical protein